MSEISDRYRRLSAAFADKIAAVPPDRWATATPCTDWSVRDLVRHVAETPVMFLGLVGRELRPGPTIDRFVSFDLAVHGWDLARATGQDERIDPGELARLWESVELFGDAIRSEGTCGPAVDPPLGADERTRLLAHLGRRA